MTTRVKRGKAFREGRGYTREDWDAVADNPQWTKDAVKAARPFSEAFPELTDSIKRARGRPRVESPKEAVTLRLDPATLAKFRAAGKDWRAKMAEVLAKARV